jgi:predicted MFS family arabinose efflux permease
MAGLRYVWRTDELRRPLILMTVIYTTAFQWGVLIPLMAERVFRAGPREFGLLSAATGVGLFVAAITRAQRGTPPTMRLLGAAAAGTGATMAVAAIAPNLQAGELAMVAVGFAAMTFMITANTMLQLTAKPEARGRVMALYGMVFLGSTPIGAPLMGVIAEHAGVRTAFLLAASIPLIVGAWVVWQERARVTTSALGTAEVETAG